MHKAFQKINVLEAVISLINLNQVHSQSNSMIQTYDPESELLFQKALWGMYSHHMFLSVLLRYLRQENEKDIQYSTLISVFLCSLVENMNKQIKVSYKLQLTVDIQFIRFCYFRITQLFFGTVYSSLLLVYHSNHLSLRERHEPPAGRL